MLDIPIPSGHSLMPPPHFQGKEGKNRAASLIISYWKMKSVRDKYLQLRRSTIIIQGFFRKKLMRLKLENDV